MFATENYKSMRYYVGPEDIAELRTVTVSSRTAWLLIIAARCYGSAACAAMSSCGVCLSLCWRFGLVVTRWLRST